MNQTLTKTESPTLKHIIEVDQFTVDFLVRLFARVPAMREIKNGKSASVLSGRTMATLFYEPSTRTRMSFEAAMHRLGGCVIGTENAREFSSVTKGETLADTIKVIAGYADVIVLRHHEKGSADIAAEVNAVPIINGGDGPGEHPTQALLDLFTIQDELGRINGLHVVMVGDLKYGRTVHSLARILKLFDVKMTFVSPEVLRLPEHIRLELEGKDICETDDLRAVMPEADIVYMTRIQKERFDDPESARQALNGHYVLNKELLALAKPKMAILHPLPRNHEISEEIDSDPRAAYVRQAHNGVEVRMALLEELLNPFHG